MINDKFTKHTHTLNQLCELYPSYLERVNVLFGTSHQLTQLAQCLIIKNHQQIFNLIHNQELMKESSSEKIHQALLLVTEVIIHYFAEYPPNIFFCREEKTDAKQSNMIGLLLEKMIQFPELSEGFHKIFQLICQNCPLNPSSFWKITRKLTDLYYESKLSPKILENACRMLYSVEAKPQFQFPSLYFDGNSSVGLKLMLSQNKWPFSKGLHLSMWIKAYQGEGKLLHLATQGQKQLIIKIANKQLIAECIELKTKTQVVKDTRRICQIPLNTVFQIKIILESRESMMFFGDPQYHLHIGVDEHFYQSIQLSIPKFTNQYITLFNLLCSFDGIFYSLVLMNNHLQKIDNILLGGQDSIVKFIEEHDEEAIISLVSVARCYKGILLNYVDVENNHVCFESSSVLRKFPNMRIVSSTIFPLLYFCLCLGKAASELNKILFQAYATEVDKYQLVYLLYFIEMSDYAIEEKTLQQLVDLDNPTFNKYLDAYRLSSRNIKLRMEEVEFNPATKLQLLFYLQTYWKEQWNRLQCLCQWWKPSFLHYQNHQSFQPSKYQYKKSEILVQWKVQELITNDFCHPVIGPSIIIPEYGNFHYFQQLYKKKQCTEEYFDEKIHQIEHLSTMYRFAKVSKSSFSRLKQKLLKKDRKNQKLKVSRIEKNSRQPLLLECCWISLLSLVKGILHIDDKQLIFTPLHNTNKFDHMCIKGWKNQSFVYFHINLADIRQLKRRRYNQSENGLEIKMKDGHHKLFYFYSKTLEKLLTYLEVFSSIPVQLEPYDTYLKAKEPLQWIDKQISNYQYLQWLNDVSGRSYTDITQYPFLPWVFISNESQIMWKDQNFRELQKNMGSFGPEERVNHFLEKFTTISQTQIFSDYHFGTHYSSSAIICNYMIRLEPFAAGARALQSGKFDVADRLFASYVGSWINATTSPTDLRELIPEIYFLPELFFNINNYDFGLTQEKEFIHNVQLPKWSNSNPYVFCATLRRSLQKDIVSEKIKNWIDLIYGYKQKGKSAVDSMNIFFPLTYENAINLDKVLDEEEKTSMETQIAHFGQNPSQIIGSRPHPQRLAIKQVWENKLLTDGSELAIKRCSLAKLKSKDKFQFGSAFEDKNCILTMKFLNESSFFVLRRCQFVVFQIIKEKQGFISKEREIDYVLQSEHIDYNNIPASVPIANANNNIIVFGGFFNGTLQILFINEPKYNGSIKLDMATITALAFSEQYEYLYVGDSEGVIAVYKLIISQEHLEFLQIRKFQAHQGRINNIYLQHSANLMLTSSEDSRLKLFNLYSQHLYRILENKNGPTIYGVISVCPLYCIVFYSPNDASIYCYSINGQFLSKIQEKTGWVYNIFTLAGSDRMESLIYLNKNRQILVNQLPELHQKKKIRLKKDEFKISCFESQERIALVGSQDGAIQLISDSSNF